MNNLSAVFNVHNLRDLNRSFTNDTDSTNPTSSDNSNYEFDKWILIVAITGLALVILGTVTLVAYIECSERKRLRASQLNQMPRIPFTRTLQASSFARNASVNNSAIEEIEMS